MALSKEEIKKITGQQGAERTPFYKLNEVTMSGDDGSFRLRELLADKNAEGRYNIEQLGNELSGVILKMRWKLSKYEEDSQSLSTTEYDNKNTDIVTVFPSKEKGKAVVMKEKYALSTQRVVYLYLPAKQQIVRLIVKASALTGTNNPGKELGLFEYVDTFNNDTNSLLNEYITVCKGVHRPDPKGNKRKDYFAMSFSLGRKLTDSELVKTLEMIEDVHGKTSSQTHEIEAGGVETVEPKDDINPDDIPFD